MCSALLSIFGLSGQAGLSGSHFSQRSGSEVTLLLHRAARASDSSSHHTNCSSSAGCNRKERKSIRDSESNRLQRKRQKATSDGVPTRSLLSRNHSGCSCVTFMGVDCRQ